jgi:hypothetical protein
MKLVIDIIDNNDNNNNNDNNDNMMISDNDDNNITIPIPFQQSSDDDIYILTYVLHFCSMLNHTMLIDIETPLISTDMESILEIDEKYPETYVIFL